MSEWLRDIRHALRFCRRNKGFTAISVAVLALGLGANSALFSLFNALVLSPMPFPQAERLVWLNTTYEAAGFDSVNVSHADLQDWLAATDVLESAAHFSQTGQNLTSPGMPQRLQGARTSWNLFSLLGVQPVLGRTFLAEDEDPQASSAVVISQRLYESRFGGDPAVLGRTVILDERPHVLIGVAPSLRIMAEVDLWTLFQPSDLSARGNRFLNVVGRLEESASIELARGELQRAARNLESRYPETNEGRGVRVLTMGERQAGDARPVLLALHAVAFFILLIASANVANLLLSRAAERQRESAVRTALGAGRRQLLRHYLSESLVIGLLGAAAGLVLAWITMRTLVVVAPPEAALRSAMVLEPEVLAFTVMLSVAASLLFGMAPALHLMGADPYSGLKAGAREGGGRRAGLRGVFVAGQVTVATVLLVGTGLIASSLTHLHAVDVGFDSPRLLSLRLDLTSSRYDNDEGRIAFERQVAAQVAGLPQVESAALISMLPLSGRNTQTTIRKPGEERRSLAESEVALIYRSSPSVFETMGIPIVRGRPLERGDTPSSPGVVVINQALAAKFWPERDPIGERLVLGRSDERQVVGVARNIVQGERGREELQIFVPYSQSPASFVNLLVRTRTDPASLSDAVLAAIHRVDPDQPAYRIAEMETLFADSLSAPRAAAIFSGSFAALALTLSVLGIYGLVAFWVRRSTGEIGVRMALGARRSSIFGLVLGRGMRYVLIGAALGLAGGLAVGKVLEGVLFGVSATDPLPLFLAVGALSFAALMACYLPARRALRIEPSQALRYE